MLKFVCSVLCVILGSSLAHAGLYLEPYGGSISGKLKTHAVLGQQTSDVESTESTGMYGGKLGVSFIGLALGADYMTGGKENPITNIGGFLSYTFPIPLKLSASYFPSSQIKDVTLFGSDNIEYKETFKGAAYKVGLGYCFLPLFAVNVDYVMHKWTDAPLHGLTSVEIKYDAVLVGLSFPISL